MPDQAKINFYPFSAGAALHRAGSHRIWVLNHSSAVLWCLYEEHGEGDSLIQAYAAHFRIPINQAKPDVRKSLAQFQQIQNDTGRKSGQGKEFWKQESGNWNAVHGMRQSVTSDQKPVTGHWNRIYSLDGVTWRISCDSIDAAEKWFKCLEHLEIETGKADLHYAVSRRDHAWIIESENGTVKNLADNGVLPTLLTRLFGDLCASLSQYLLLHAAAAVKDDRLVMFPGESAFGKSTLSAALAASGWTLYSDELAPLDTKQLRVVPFVLPVGIKSRSLTVLQNDYPDLVDQPAYGRLDGQIVRYLSASQIDMASAVSPPRDVSALIFPRYVPGSGTKRETLSPLQALELLADTGSSERPLEAMDVKALLALAGEKPCWSLIYSDLGEAVEAVGSMTSDQ